MKIHTVFVGTDREFTGTLSQIARHFDIDRGTLQSRLQKGATLEEAIETPLLGQALTVFAGTDREFTGNLKEIAEHFGINYSTLVSRMSNGVLLEEALSKPVEEKRKRLKESYTVYAGTDKEFTGNKKQIARHFGIGYRRLYDRVKNGMTFEEALNMPKVERNNVHTVFSRTNREFTGTLSQIAQHFDANYNTLVIHMKKYGMTLEEALDFKKEHLQ